MSRKEDILTALRDLNDQDLRTAGAALFDALGYRSTRTFEDLPTDPTSFWDFFSQGHSDLDPGKAEIERWRGAAFLFQLTDAEVHDLAKAREATKEHGDYEESEIESFLFLAIDLEGEQWTRTRLAQITRTLNRLFLMPAIVLFRHGGLASLAVIDRRQSKVDAAKDVILAKKIAIVKDIRLAKPHRAHIDILERLTFANLNRGRNITTFRALYDAWLAACSVETLTKEFFTKLSELFFDTSDSVATRFPDENERRLFVQTLFNRLIFLRFVEEKGWMKIDGRYDYLQALWEKARDSNQPLWPTRLNALFGAVNHPISDKVHEVAKPIIGTVPYLNGGLFEDDSRFADPTVQFPDVVFDRLVGAEGLLYRYLFTVEESTPLDVQVAVDPEILGKIFEQLTIATKRHDTGSYYTPREIVQFMCREALVGYLTSPRPSGGEGSGVRELPEAKARALVYDHDDSTLTNQEGNQAFEALKAIKVVDPACGSGAYLLGMLQELYALFEKLRRDDRKFSDDPAKEAHERKLWIIENNIYGVDLQAFATNTAMLRLWLTLLVEDTGERPQPLPNLEYKIETGDSLLGPDPSQPIDWSKQEKGTQEGLDLWDKDKTLRDLRDLRETYQNSHADKKTKVKKDLEAKLAELREKVTGSPIKDPVKFDWRVEFFDVFLDDPKQRRPGFDVALANPPYVRDQLINRQKPALKGRYPEVYHGKADLYTYFFCLAVELLSRTGQLAFITPNRWLKTDYAAKLRQHMASSLGTRYLVNFDDLPVFQEQVTYTLITVASKSAVAQTTYLHVRSLEPPYPDFLGLVGEQGVVLLLSAHEDVWRLDLENRQPRNAVPLANYSNGGPFLGLKTGWNDPFYLSHDLADRLVSEDARIAPMMRPLVRGQDVRRWTGFDDVMRVLWVHDLESLSDYPVLEAYFAPFKPRLELRQNRGRRFWQFRSSRLYGCFDAEKIVFPDIALGARFGLVRRGAVVDTSAFFLPGRDLFLLGVLNSAPALSLFDGLGVKMRGGFYRFNKSYSGRIPVPSAGPEDRAAVESLVQECLDAKAADPDADVSAWEAEIDAIVERLYFG